MTNGKERTELGFLRATLLICLLIAGCSGDREREFDQARWRNADLAGRERAKMMPSLLRTHPLKGMARDQVIALLGEPSDTQKWPDANLIYVLGNDGTYMPIDNEWLLIKLGEDGRVVSWRRAKD